MIKAVLFDLDGTLLDREESVRKFIAMQYDRLKSELGHIVKEDYINR
ncbi:HAD family hydrolase [Metabacillus niabensis]|uniref:Phosphoglycolate phosphatase-like HAD superfamily hydrolase n=1 Tax=Metabacillus niabensis TaxID=324854 RepID=A0ABT9Z240_9BACI|nr:HAD family hydrolase [Metabacillus niabensis]MDQ0226314.1 phosphoglycolate phosphatase-like HAD superfamily hydrolase [Metabacillus niabensis]